MDKNELGYGFQLETGTIRSPNHLQNSANHMVCNLNNRQR